MTYDEEKDVSNNRTSQDSVSDGLEELPLTGDEHRLEFRSRRRNCIQWPANDSHFWKYYSLFMTTVSLILLLTTVHENTKPTMAKKCPAPEHCSMPLEYVKTTPSELHGKAHESLPVDDRLDGYPLGLDSYHEDNVVTTKFYRDLRYMTLDHEADYLWEEHLHMITGNIKLPPADASGNASMKAIAMFHQMHCLAAFRGVLQKAREGEKIGKDETDDFHWPHCFDYLRMSILCFADPTLESITLEPGPIDDGKVVRVIDGGADTRYCRNSNPLYMLERKYGPNSQYGYAAHHGSN